MRTWSREFWPSGEITEAAAHSADGPRRFEILEIAATLFASSGYAGTSLKDIADACGILPGSLYHHFESKEAIVVELVARYQEDLDEIGAAALAGIDGDTRPSFDQIAALSVALAEASVRHRAAMHLTAYEPPSGASHQLIELSRHIPRKVNAAMQEILHRGRTSGFIKPGVDTVVLADQLSLTMRTVGLSFMHLGPADVVAQTLCHMLLFGIADRPPTDAVLDQSAAMVAAETAVREWMKRKDTIPEDKAATLRALARTEFARRGYEATTIRDIAAAAGMGTGSVYRIIQSKETLLSSIMDSYHLMLSQGYDAVLAAGSSDLEKLDALTWLNINVRVLFGEEFAIQQSWLRATPPTAAYVGEPHKQRAKQIGTLIAEGFRSGEMHAGNMDTTTTLEVLRSCIRDLIWLPGDLVALLGNYAALRHSRATLFRGAAVCQTQTGRSAITVRSGAA